MIEIEKPNIATVNLSEDGRSGKFIIEPLERAPLSAIRYAGFCSALSPVLL